MRRTLLAAAAAALAACAQTPEAANPPDGGAVALAAVGTPFLVVAKIPLCALTLVAAGPVGALSAIGDPDTAFGRDVRQGLADGIDNNCGPPFAVTP